MGMMKKMAILLLIIYGVWVIGSGVGLSKEQVQTAQEKAEEIHKRASSDIIYADDELKALYYQNIQMIDLLKQIRELLKLQIEAEKEG